LEQRFPQMVNKLEDKEMELRRIKDDNDELKYKLKVINEENFAKMIELEKMSSEIVDLNLNLEEKEANVEELQEKYEEVVNKLNIAVRNCDELTDRNRCRKSTLTQDNADTIEEVSEGEEDVFEEEMQVDVGDSSTSATPGGINYTNCSNVSDSEYDVSAGTIAKAEELDERVRDLWTRLSSRDETFDELQSNYQKLGESVTNMKKDLNQSIIQNNTLYENVNFAKKLFHYH